MFWAAKYVGSRAVRRTDDQRLACKKIYTVNLPMCGERRVDFLLELTAET